MSARDDLVRAMGKCWIVEPEDETGTLEWLVIGGVRFAGVELELQRRDSTDPDEWGWTIYRLGRGHHKLTDCPPDKWKERNAWASGYADTREEAKAAAVEAVADWLHPVIDALALLDAEPVAWIPVSERLPDEGAWVWGLYWNDYSEQWEQEEVQYTHEDGWWTEDTSMNQPKYWSAKSPLPARPEASDE